jgi:hypothetical protein
MARQTATWASISGRACALSGASTRPKVEERDQFDGDGQGAAADHADARQALHGSFSTKATAARSFAGKFVLVQRLSSTGVATLKKVTLDASSSATFRVRLHHGRNRLRVVMPSSQTASGYITGMSKVLTVSR